MRRIARPGHAERPVPGGQSGRNKMFQVLPGQGAVSQLGAIPCAGNKAYAPRHVTVRNGSDDPREILGDSQIAARQFLQRAQPHERTRTHHE